MLRAAGGRRPGCAGRRCRRRCTWPARCSRYRAAAAAPSGCASVRARCALRARRPGRPGHRPAQLRRLAGASTARTPRRRRRCGTWSASRRSTPRADAGLAGAGRDGLPDRPARPTPPPPTSAGRGSRSAAARRRPPATRAGRGRRRRCAPRTRVDARSSRDGRRAGWRLGARSATSPVDQVVAAPSRRRGGAPAARRRGRRRAGLGRAAGQRRRSSTCTSCYDRRVLDRAVPRRASARRCSGSSTARPQSGLTGSGPVPRRLAVGRRRADRRAGRRELRATVRCRRWPRCCRRARGARSLDFFVTRERHATFRPAPGSGRAAPAGAARHGPGLYLAGAWTATGWPATMEGAVRSGHAGGRRRCSARGRPRRAAEPACVATWRTTLTAARPSRDARRARRCARPSTGSTRPAGRVAAYHFGWIDAAGQPTARRRRQGRAARAGPAVGAGRRWRRPRSGCPARSRSSWCTTSRCCTTT